MEDIVYEIIRSAHAAMEPGRDVLSATFAVKGESDRYVLTIQREGGITLPEVLARIKAAAADLRIALQNYGNGDESYRRVLDCFDDLRDAIEGKQ